MSILGLESVGGKVTICCCCQWSSSHSSHVAVSVRFAVMSSVLLLHVRNFFVLREGPNFLFLAKCSFWYALYCMPLVTEEFQDLRHRIPIRYSFV